MATSKEKLQAASIGLLMRAEEAGLTLPGKSVAERRVNVGQLLLQCRNADGSYDVEKAWGMMQAKFKVKKEKNVKKEEAREEESGGKEDEKERPAKKKAKKAAPAEVKKEKVVQKKKEEKKEREEEEEEKEEKEEKEESDEEEEKGGKKEKKGKGKSKAKKAVAPKANPAAKQGAKSEGVEKEEEEEEEEEEEAAEGKTKKRKEKVVLHCDENEELAKCFLELGRGYYKQNDMMRGAAYMKAYKSLMECDEAITSGKQAQNLKGVGKSSANKVQEFLDSGKIATLEEMKAEAEAVM